MLHNECLYPSLQGAVGIGHDFVARQCQEVRKEGRVDHWGKGEALNEGESEVRQCIHGEVCTH